MFYTTSPATSIRYFTTSSGLGIAILMYMDTSLCTLHFEEAIETKSLHQTNVHRTESCSVYVASYDDPLKIKITNVLIFSNKSC